HDQKRPNPPSCQRVASAVTSSHHTSNLDKQIQSQKCLLCKCTHSQGAELERQGEEDFAGTLGHPRRRKGHLSSSHLVGVSICNPKFLDAEEGPNALKQLLVDDWYRCYPQSHERSHARCTQGPPGQASLLCRSVPPPVKGKPAAVFLIC